jgi:hypothetical protein
VGGGTLGIQAAARWESRRRRYGNLGGGVMGIGAAA